MNSTKAIIGLIVLLVLGTVAASCLYIVSETQTGIVLRFGEISESNLKPGLHFKWPIVNEVKLFEGRLVTLDTPNAVRFLTKEKKSVMVDAFARWRIADPKLFYTSVRGDRQTAEDRLGRRLDAALRDEFGSKTLTELVTNNRDRVMIDVTKSLNEMAQKELGIEVLDVRVKAIDLPKEVNDSVFERMKTEREREAQHYRSVGEEEAAKIRANADKERQLLLATAKRTAEEIKAKGDAEAALIYATSFSKNPEFYNFFRSLQAYRESFNNKNDVLVLDPNSDFFKYLKQPNVN